MSLSKRRVSFAGEELLVFSVTADNGEIWLLADPFARILGYGSHVSVQNNVSPENVREYEKIGSLTALRTCNMATGLDNGNLIQIHANSKFVNCVGLFELIDNSPMRNAVEFKTWLTGVLLPMLCGANEYSMVTDAMMEKAAQMDTVRATTTQSGEEEPLAWYKNKFSIFMTTIVTLTRENSQFIEKIEKITRELAEARKLLLEETKRHLQARDLLVTEADRHLETRRKLMKEWEDHIKTHQLLLEEKDSHFKTHKQLTDDHINTLRTMTPSRGTSLMAKPNCGTSLIDEPSRSTPLMAKPNCGTSLIDEPSCSAPLTGKPSWSPPFIGKSSWSPPFMDKPNFSLPFMNKPNHRSPHFMGKPNCSGLGYVLKVYHLSSYGSGSSIKHTYRAIRCQKRNLKRLDRKEGQLIYHCEGPEFIPDFDMVKLQLKATTDTLNKNVVSCDVGPDIFLELLIDKHRNQEKLANRR